MPYFSRGDQMDLPIIFYAVISNAIVIMNLCVIAFALYKVHKKHFYNLHRKSGIIFLILFPLILCFPRLALIFAFITVDYTVYIIIDWITALIVSITAFKYHSYLENILRMETVKMNQELVDSLSRELYVREEIQNDLENKNIQLVSAIKRLNHILESHIWVHDRKKAISELEEILRVTKKNVQ